MKLFYHSNMLKSQFDMGNAGFIPCSTGIMRRNSDGDLLNRLSFSQTSAVTAKPKAPRIPKMEATPAFEAQSKKGFNIALSLNWKSSRAIDMSDAHTKTVLMIALRIFSPLPREYNTGEHEGA
ncbi:MAG: hypothetical protein Q7T04_04590 [Dehalococcoidia bacterium]|nr:hypothetical protein [Dehalococcoidia bacterium]